MPFDQTESDVAQFFSNKEVTKAECDAYLNQKFQELGKPAKIQGSNSYTVIISSLKLAVQFRSGEVDVSHWVEAKSIYGDLVPSCRDAKRKIKDLSIYFFEEVNGIACIGMKNRLQNTKIVEDFAKFFALSWMNSDNTSSAEREPIQTEFHDKLTTLSTVLPETSGKLQHVLKHLESLFTTTYPQVLTHDDLNEMNIMVNVDDGSITGIVDWVDSRVLPFGISLYGLENLLGYMDSEGWHYSDSHVELRTLFWDVFNKIVGEISDAQMEAIEVARMAGLFMRYGFTWVGLERVPNPDSAYLRAFCL